MAGFRLGVRAGRAVLLERGRSIDVAERSNGRFDADPMTLFARWANFAEWAHQQAPSDGDPGTEESGLDLCVPRPSSIFGIGVNYRDHIAEAGMDMPTAPMVFTKFPACLAHGTADIPLTSNRVDWEAELVVVIGQGGRNIAPERWRDAVAGFCVGQDISDRRQQFNDKPPQFSLGKSAKGFGPIGPCVVSLDAFGNPEDLAISCSISGKLMQTSRTSNMIFSIPELIGFISRWCKLRPGDLIFTGTPGGTGGLQNPRRYLAPGDEVVTTIEGIGSIHNRCVAQPTLDHTK